MNEQTASLLTPGRRLANPFWARESDPYIQLPDAHAMSHGVLLHVCAAEFNKLPDDEQKLLVAVDVEGLPYEQVASRMRCSQSWLPSLVFQARHRLYSGIVFTLAEA